MAYNSARKNGWLDNYTWFERPVAYNKKWNRETCYDEAKKYKSKAEFRKNSGGAYKVAYNNGWFDDYSWFESNQKPNGYWNRKTCYDEAMRYKSRGEFAKRSNSAYKVAKKNGWLNDYTWFSPSALISKWNYDTCYEEAQKHKSRGEFRKRSVRAYNVALKNGWLDDYKWFSPSASAKKWNHDTCYEEAKKYKSKAEFEKKASGAYNVARREGWLVDYIWFKKPTHWNKKWNRDTCRREAAKYKSRGDFCENASGAYNVARKNGWLDDYSWFVSGKEIASEKRRKWNYDTCREEAINYKSRSEFAKGSKTAYQVARKNGWLKDYTWFVNKRTT